MERRQQEAAMEAVLFAMGESVEIGKLAEVIEEDEDTARQIINEMKEKWEKTTITTILKAIIKK